MRLRRPFGSIALGLGLLGASCLPGGRLPPAGPPPSRGATPLSPAEIPLPPDEGPLKLAFSTPQGDEVAAPLPTFVFTRSMHRLGAPPDDPPVVATVDPPLEGSWHWVGARALQFTPRKTFAGATRYRIEIKPGLRSLDGQSIDQALSLEFSTPRLRTTQASLEDEATGKLWIAFNQEVAPEELRAAVLVTDEDGKKIPLRILDKKATSSFEILPARRWPEGVALRLEVRPPLRGTAGALGLAAPYTQLFRERRPTIVESLGCSQQRDDATCEEGTDVSLSLSEPMTLASLRPLVRVEPPIPFTLQPADTSAPREPQSSFELVGKFRLGVPYKVTIRSSTVRQRGIGGLDQGATLSFKTVPPLPWINHLARGTFLRPSWTDALQASAHRVEAASFSVTPLSPEDILAARVERKPTTPRARLAEKKTRNVTADPKRSEGTIVNLGELFPKTPGPVLLESQGKGPDGESTQSQLFQRTELAISSRLSPEDSLFWVTRLTSAEPVSGAEVTVHDLFGRKASGKTDAQGVALIDTRALGVQKEDPAERWKDRSLLVIARSGDDWIYTDESKPREPRPEAALFADRGLYRPGETVHLKGVMRMPSSRGLVVPPEGHEVRLTYQLRGGSEVKISKKLSAWGTFSHDVELPPEMPPSSVVFRIEGERRDLAVTRALVQHVRPLAFRVDAALDRASYTAGDPFLCSGRAVYLNGGSMRGMKGSARAVMTPTSVSIPGLSDFFVGQRYLGSRGSKTLAEAREQLGADGSIRSSGKIESTPDDGPVQLACEVEVQDPGEQVIEGTAEATVHPASFYVALQDRAWHVAPREELKIKALAVALDGTRRAEKVRIELRDPAAPRGDTRGLLGACEVTTGSSPITCTLRAPGEHGTAFLIEATSVDNQGRRVVTSTRGATHPRPPRGTPPPRPVPQARPAPPEPPKPLPPPPFLVASEGPLSPGEKATVTLNPRFKGGQGLLTFEREGIAGHQFLGASTRSTMTIEATMAPRVVLYAEQVYPVTMEVPYTSPGVLSERDSQDLRVEGVERSLRVKVTPSKEQAAPGDTIDVEVQVADGKGQGFPAEVTLYAVDEGVLQLTGYRIPELASMIEPSAEHLVHASNTRSDVGWLLRPGRGRLSGSHRTRPPMIRMGATSVSDRDMPRSDFRATPLFLPTLETDAQGHARASFKLPDSLTAYRIMAVAAGKSDHFGQAEATVKAKLAVQIRPVIPQAIRAGDRFEAAAIAANNTTAALDVTVSLQAEGFETPANAPKKLRLEPGASERVTFPVEARRVGPGKLTFRLEGGDGLRDAAEAPLTAQSPVSLEASALYGKTEGATLESVADLSTIRGDVGGLDLTVSSSPVSGLAPGLEQLVEYPYGCTEQLTSRLVPLVALRELARALAVPLPEDVAQESQKAVEKILQNSHRDGSFGLWRSSNASPWITAYAYWGLSEASRHGVSVPSSVFEQGARQLTSVAGRWAEGKRQAAEATFALDVLVDLPGADDTARSHALILARQMVDHRADLPAFARSQLLHALARLGAPPDELAPLVRDLEASLHLDGPLARVVEPSDWYPELLDTRARSGAMALRALLAAAPGHPMLEPLARGLIADRGPKGWKTTQESAWALLALDGYRRTLAAGGGGARVSLGSERLLEGPFAGLAEEKRVKVSVEKMAASGGAPLLFEALGGVVYYQARLRYAPAVLPTAPVQAGLDVVQRCRAVAEKNGDEEGAVGTTFRVGDWVRCEVEVSTPTARNFVVLDNPIPGGFEAVNPDVQGVPGRIRKYLWGPHNQQEFRPERVTYFADHLSPGVHRWSYVARAMTAGEYVVPPARIEEMYAPEVYGRTGSTRVTITP